MDQAHLGETALSNKDPALALNHFSSAILAHPTSPAFHIQRSTAHTRLNQHAAALADADTATNLAVKRGKRELIAKAQLRRGISLFGLERWGDAGFVLKVAREFDEREKSVGIWLAKVDMKMEALDVDDERRKVTVERMPAERKEFPKTPTASTPAAAAPSVPATAKPPQQPLGCSTPAHKIRHEWYQTSTTVSISLLAKSVPRESATISINPTLLCISFPLPDGTTHTTTFDPLAHTIDTANSSARVLGTKIEVTLRKTQGGVQWKELQGTADSASQSNGKSAAPAPGTDDAATATPAPSGPAYPTSSLRGPRNWDKIAQSYVKPGKSSRSTTKSASNPQPEDGQPTQPGPDANPDADSDDSDGGDQVNALFRKLYRDANDDTKRAMMKSFTESNGTALSTNWEEVGRGKVETSPPEGMESREWGR